MKGLRYWIFGLMLSLIVTTVMLFIVEAVLRIVHTDPGFVAIEQAEKEGQPFDSRSRIEVAHDLRASGTDAVPQVISPALRAEMPDKLLRSPIIINGKEVLPLAGISRKTTVLCNETGKYAIYESDEHGFRNPLGIWETGAAELLLLGDSYTLGNCVASEQALGALIRNRVPATLNLGYSGHSPLFELATLKEYGIHLKPRIVLWFYFENDLWWFDLGKDRRTPLLMRYLEEDFTQSLLTMQPEIDRSLTEHMTSLPDELSEPSPVTIMQEHRGDAFTRLSDFLQLKSLRTIIGRFRNPASSASREAPDYHLFKTILRQAKATVRTWDGEFLVVYLPGVWNFEGRQSAVLSQTIQTREWIKELLSSLDIRMIDVKPEMDRHKDPLSLYSYRGSTILGSPHLNADGYAFAAEIVLSQLGK